jgi:hypothetical protein
MFPPHAEWLHSGLADPGVSALRNHFLCSAYMNAIFCEGSTFDFPNARVNSKIVALKKKKIESHAKNCEGLWIISKVRHRRRASQATVAKAASAVLNEKRRP